MSGAYTELKEELNHKTEKVADDLLLIEKSYANEEKMRGNLIEYFIKSTDELKKRELNVILRKKLMLKIICLNYFILKIL